MIKLEIHYLTVAVAAEVLRILQFIIDTGVSVYIRCSVFSSCAVPVAFTLTSICATATLTGARKLGGGWIKPSLDMHNFSRKATLELALVQL